MLVENMRGDFRKICNNYCYSNKDLLSKGQYYSIEQYIKASMIDRVGSWGTDIGIILSCTIVKNRHFCTSRLLTQLEQNFWLWIYK